MSLRNYGLPESTPVDTPTWKRDASAPPCPNCEAEVVKVTLVVEQKLLKGGMGTGTYWGCPACPWASPMQIRRLPDQEDA